MNSISTIVCENSPIIGPDSMVFGVILSTVILIFAMPITNRGLTVCTKPYHNSSRKKWLNKALQWAHQGKQQARLLLACISSTSMIFTVDSRKGGVRIPQITDFDNLWRPTSHKIRVYLVLQTWHEDSWMEIWRRFCSEDAKQAISIYGGESTGQSQNLGR